MPRVYRDARAVHIKLPAANRYSVNFRVVAKSVVPGLYTEEEKRKSDKKKKKKKRKLTDDGEEHGMTYGWRRRHLTLVCARISSLGVFHL